LKEGKKMNKKYAHIIDSSLAPDLSYFEQHQDYFLLPLYTVIDGKLYKDMLDISTEAFYEKVRAGSDVKTTQATVGEYLAEYENVRELGYTDAFLYSITSEMSGTIDAARKAAELVEGINVYVIDTKTVAAVGSGVIEHISEFAKTTDDPAEIVAYAENLFERVDIFVVVNSLDALAKGGRIAPAKAAIGNLLNVKPVLLIHHGVIDVIGKERTLKKAVRKIMQTIGQKPFHTGMILHSNNEQMRDALIEAYEEAYPNKPYVVLSLSSVVGVHAGPETGAIGVIWEEENTKVLAEGA